MTTEIVTLTYPFEHHGEIASFFKGGSSKSIIFPDTLTNVTAVDFTVLTTSDGTSVEFSNTTTKINGTFSFNVSDESGNILWSKSVSVTKKGTSNNTRNFAVFGVIEFDSPSNVKSITLEAETNNANISMKHDDSSFFQVLQQRQVAEFSISPTSLTWSHPETGNTRLVQRFENLDRNIADVSDIVVSTDGVVSSLAPETEYTFAVQKNGNEWYDVWTETITTGTIPVATLRVGETKASMVDLSWESEGEDDGVTEFKIRLKNSDDSYTDATQWIQGLVNSTTITGLDPETQYEFQLIRMESGGLESPQTVVDVTTQTSTIRVEETASNSIRVSWDEMYQGARFTILYKPETGGDAVTLGGEGASTEDTDAILTGLSPDTNYVLELYVTENGNLVGTNKLSLGTGVKARTNRSHRVIGGTIVSVVAFIAIILLILRTRMK